MRAIRRRRRLHTIWTRTAGIRSRLATFIRAIHTSGRRARACCPRSRRRTHRNRSRRRTNPARSMGRRMARERHAAGRPDGESARGSELRDGIREG